MSAVRILIKKDGLYVENPQADRKYINDLKESLDELGVSDFNEPDFVKMLKDAESDLIRVSSKHAQDYKDAIHFKPSQEDSRKIVATIIPHSIIKPFSKLDILVQLEYDNFQDVTPDIRAIEDAIEQQGHETEIYTFIAGIRNLPYIEIFLSPDYMEANILVQFSHENQRVYEEDIMMTLKEAGVVHGIRKNVIREIVEANECPEPVIIARGIESIDGEPGSVMFHFDAQKKKQGPQIDTKGRADFHHLGIFESIEKGGILCELISPGRGMPGYDIKGKETEPNFGKKATLPSGKNTMIDPGNPNLLIATITGIPKCLDGQVSVEPILNIEGDVGLETGDIEFIGAVRVNGMVNDGFKIIAKDDIYIHDTCESLHLETDGDIFINRGIRADKDAFLKAGGNVHALFLEGVNIEAGGEVVIMEYAYHCHIKSKNSVRVLGKKGYIAGGSVTVEKNVLTKRLGSLSAPRTEIYISPSSEEIVQLTENQVNKMEKWIIKLSEIQIEIDRLTEICDEMPDDKSLEAKEKAEWQKVEAMKIIRQFDPGFIDPALASEQYIGVLGVVHPNVHIQINQYKMTIKQEFDGVRFFVRKHRVVMESFDNSNIKDG
jgi:uncharacterized protein (DUF342 family)